MSSSETDLLQEKLGSAKEVTSSSETEFLQEKLRSAQEERDEYRFQTVYLENRIKSLVEERNMLREELSTKLVGSSSDVLLRENVFLQKQNADLMKESEHLKLEIMKLEVISGVKNLKLDDDDEEDETLANKKGFNNDDKRLNKTMIVDESVFKSCLNDLRQKAQDFTKTLILLEQQFITKKQVPPETVLKTTIESLVESVTEDRSNDEKEMPKTPDSEIKVGTHLGERPGSSKPEVAKRRSIKKSMKYPEENEVRPQFSRQVIWTSLLISVAILILKILYHMYNIVDEDSFNSFSETFLDSAIVR